MLVFSLPLMQWQQTEKYDDVGEGKVCAYVQLKGRARMKLVLKLWEPLFAVLDHILLLY